MQYMCLCRGLGTAFSVTNTRISKSEGCSRNLFVLWLQCAKFQSPLIEIWLHTPNVDFPPISHPPSCYSVPFNLYDILFPLIVWSSPIHIFLPGYPPFSRIPMVGRSGNGHRNCGVGGVGTQPPKSAPIVYRKVFSIVRGMGQSGANPEQV